MNILCSICSELFINGTDIYFTHCGHVFHYQCLISWLERSRSCPQCRTRVTEKTIHKVYFTIPNSEPAVDATTLMFKLENTTFSLSLKEKEIKNLNETTQKLKDQNLGLRKEVAQLESDIGGIKSKMHDLQSNVRFYKNRAAETDRLAEEVVKLKSTIKSMENAEIVVNGTLEQVNSILNENNNIESLALLVATLKKSLLASEKKSRDSDFRLKKAKNELQLIKKQHTLLETQNADLRREFNQLKLKCEREKSILKIRLKSAVQNNIVVANPNAGNSDTKSTTTVDSANNSSLNATSKKERKSFSMSDMSNTENSENNLSSISLSTTLNVPERVTAIESSDSPYLPVKTNFGSYLNTKYTAPSTVISNSTNKQYSIFKTQEKTEVNKAVNSKREDIAYDGLGGSNKEDIFPSGQGKPIKRPKTTTSLPSNKFRRLTPSASQKKINDY